MHVGAHMNTRKIATVAAAALVASLLVTATSSRAQVRRGSVVIEKHVTPTTAYVPFGDLSLASKEGRKVLHHRVGVAVNELCPIRDDDGSFYDDQGCKDLAWASAGPQITRAVRAAKAGAPALVMTISVTASDK